MKEHEELTQKIGEKNIEIKKLQHKKKQMEWNFQSKIQGLETCLKKSYESNKQLKEKLESKLEDFKAIEQEIKQKKEELKLKNDECDINRENYKKLEDKFKACKEEVEEEKKTIKQYQDDLQSKETEHKKLALRIKALEDELYLKESKYANAKQQIKKCTEELENKDKALKESEERIDGLTEMLKVKENKVTLPEGDLVYKRIENLDAQECIKQCKEKLKEQGESLKSAEEEILQEKLNDAEEHFRLAEIYYKDEVENLLKKNKQLEFKILEENNSFAMLEERNDELQSKMDAIKYLFSDQLQDVENIKKKNTKNREQIDDLQSKELESARIIEDVQHKMSKIKGLLRQNKVENNEKVKVKLEPVVANDDTESEYEETKYALPPANNSQDYQDNNSKDEEDKRDQDLVSNCDSTVTSDTMLKFEQASLKRRCAPFSPMSNVDAEENKRMKHTDSSGKNELYEFCKIFEVKLEDAKCKKCVKILTCPTCNKQLLKLWHKAINKYSVKLQETTIDEKKTIVEHLLLSFKMVVPYSPEELEAAATQPPTQ